jgi:hypothetical protein
LTIADIYFYECLSKDSHMKKLYILIVTLCSLSAYSQVGTDFWIAPPDVTDLHNSPGGEPIYLWIQPQSNNNSFVTISLPANGSFTPIVVLVEPGKSRRINLTAFKSSLETRPTNTINNTGLRIQATEPVSVQYEVANTTNTDIASLWGGNALGNYFYIPLHKHAPFNNEISFAAPHQAFTSFDIVATQNSTTIRIYSPVAVDGHAPLQQFAITLNAGQTYSAGWTGANWGQPSTHPSGAVVLSDKPVAVSIKGDSEHNPSGGCYDLQFEQIVPVSRLGTDHILVKSSLMNNTGDESAIIMSPVNGTEIYQDGAATPVAVLFAGEYYRVDMDYLAAGPNYAMHIRATNPVYVIHYTGYGCELGDAIVPPLNYGTTSVNISRGSAEIFFVNFVVRTAYINDFTITGGGTATINPAFFVTVPGTGGLFSAARIQYNTTQFPVDSTFLIQNSSGAFQVALLNGGASSGIRYTYSSPFGSLNSLPLRVLRLAGRTQTDGNYLEWIAGEDGEHYSYQLQTFEGNDWVKLDSKESGNTTANRSYQYTHTYQGGGSRKYRVTSTETSLNKTIYSNTVMLNRGITGRGNMNVYPNPSRTEVNIQLAGTDGTVTAKIYTINGQLVKQISNTGNAFSMDIKNLSSGVYMLKVEDERNQWQEKITKY